MKDREGTVRTCVYLKERERERERERGKNVRSCDLVKATLRKNLREMEPQRERESGTYQPT